MAGNCLRSFAYKTWIWLKRTFLGGVPYCKGLKTIALIGLSLWCTWVGSSWKLCIHSLTWFGALCSLSLFSYRSLLDILGQITCLRPLGSGPRNSCCHLKFSYGKSKIGAKFSSQTRFELLGLPLYGWGLKWYSPKRRTEVYEALKLCLCYLYVFWTTRIEMTSHHTQYLQYRRPW